MRMARREFLTAAAALAVAGDRARAEEAARGAISVGVAEQGAKADYSTDNTEAFQRALDSLHPTWGGTVEIPPGGFCLSGPLIIRHPGTRIRGAGREDTQIVVKDHTFDVFVLRGAEGAAAPPLNSIAIEDLWVNSYGHSGDQAWVVRDDARDPRAFSHLTGTASVQLRNLQMTGIHSGVLSTAGRFRGEGLDFRAIRPSTGIGIEIVGNGEVRDILNVWMENGGGQDPSAGIVIRGGAATTIINCELMKMGNPIRVTCDSGEIVRSIQIVSSWCDTSAGTGLVLRTTGTGNIARIAASTSWFGSCKQGISIEGNVWGLLIDNSQIIDNAEDGIYIAPGTELRGASFNQCAFALNKGSGFHAGKGVGDFSLTNSVLGLWGDFHGNGRWGCLVDDDGARGGTGAADGYIITGNRMRGNGDTGQFHDGGTGHSKIVRDNIIADGR